MGKKSKLQSRAKNGRFGQEETPQDPTSQDNVRSLSESAPKESPVIQTPLESPEKSYQHDSDDADCEFTSEEEPDDEDDRLWLAEEQKRLRAQTMSRFEAMMDEMDPERKKRGKYMVLGPSVRTVQHWKQKATASLWSGDLSQEDYETRLAEIKRKAMGNGQTSLMNFFQKRPLDTSDDANWPMKKVRAEASINASLDDGETKSNKGETSERDIDSTLEETVTESEDNGRETLHIATEINGNWGDDGCGEVQDGETDQDADVEAPPDFASLRNAANKLYRKFYQDKRFDARTTRIYASLYVFYGHIVDKRLGRIASSQLVAQELMRGPHFSRSLRKHARYFEAHGEIAPSKRGMAMRLSGLLKDENIILQVKGWLRSLPTGSITPLLLHKHVVNVVLPNCGLQRTSITIRHVRRWLYYLGYRRKAHSKGVYWDGHERKDVVKRRVEYLKELLDLERLCTQFEGDDFKRVPPVLCEGEREHVLLYHDEMSAHANDHRTTHYLKPNERMIYKKERGRLMMVSDFITAATESCRLVMSEDQVAAQALLPPDERLPPTARRVIFPDGKPTGDKYWNMEQMVDQLKQTIRLGEFLLPNRVLGFIFDNSSAHGSFAPDALRVTRMNINPGGKAPKMRDTQIPSDNPHGRANQVQSMQFPDVLDPLDPFKVFEGQPKGMAIVLEERGLIRRLDRKWVRADGTVVVGECAECKAEKARKMPTSVGEDDEEMADDSEEEDERDNCCMKRMLSMQADFKNERSMLEKIITEAGHICIFLPKFHCELNPIEYYWGWVKNFFRERCNGNFESSKRLFVDALDRCPANVIRRFIRRSDRYASIYRHGTTGPLAEYAARKFRSHRVVTQADLDLAAQEKAQKDRKQYNFMSR